MILRENAFKEL
ncbi:hypothetical protein N7537_007510 [Penicillium hordei]|uniref:Uncharacterized protein n=1 Tax=Penicillium hordei TaxID=40994 RepID=A0AAD6GZG2_9EURO|nr:hypothetical protein N7537_007510 [Penicillium hordei]